VAQHDDFGGEIRVPSTDQSDELKDTAECPVGEREGHRWMLAAPGSRRQSAVRSAGDGDILGTHRAPDGSYMCSPPSRSDRRETRRGRSPNHPSQRAASDTRSPSGPIRGQDCSWNAEPSAGCGHATYWRPSEVTPFAPTAGSRTIVWHPDRLLLTSFDQAGVVIAFGRGRWAVFTTQSPNNPNAQAWYSRAECRRRIQPNSTASRTTALHQRTHRTPLVPLPPRQILVHDVLEAWRC
jgi:hypothetical protein